MCNLSVWVTKKVSSSGWDKQEQQQKKQECWSNGMKLPRERLQGRVSYYFLFDIIIYSIKTLRVITKTSSRILGKKSVSWPKNWILDFFLSKKRDFSTSLIFMIYNRHTAKMFRAGKLLFTTPNSYIFWWY